MAIPNYQQFMLPELKYLADGAPRSRKEIYQAMKESMNLSPKDLAQMLPSGGTNTYKNRAGWGLSYMNQAGLIERVKRGVYQISDHGRKLLAANPDEITVQTLEAYPEFQAFKERSRKSQNSRTTTTVENVQDIKDDPNELLEAGYSAIRSALTEELLDTLKSVDPSRFEKIVVDVLVAMGYGGGREGAARAVGQSADGGIDGVIDEDRLGLDTIYIQAKRWEGTVGRPVVQSFAGALQGNNANKGVMITTSDYSKGAVDYARNLSTKIVLINGKRLAELMIDHDVGVSEENSYVIKRLDSDYFED